MTKGMKSLVALSTGIIHNKFVKLFVILALFLNISMPSETNEFFLKHWKLSPMAMESLKKNEIISEAEVETIENQQYFKMQGAALHNKSCTTAFRKLSRLENYKDYINFINESNYNEKNRLFVVKANHALLPFPMIVYIIVDRPTKEGKYPFSFPTGIFPGLSGDFIIKEVEGRCALYVHSFWKGNKTKIPDIVIEMFSETLARIGGEVLIRKSQH
jgi:hypothetical protein